MDPSLYSSTTSPNPTPRTITTRTRRREKDQHLKDEGDENEEKPQAGGWSSINNQAGHPYQPLGEPILDFVFQVKRKKGQTGNKSATEEKQSSDGSDDPTPTQPKRSSLPSNSLDLTDPVRDLLALCTPRRADVIDATAAIRERVTLSEARIRQVKAGGSFEEIDRCMKSRRKLEEFKRIRAIQQQQEKAKAAGTGPRPSISQPGSTNSLPSVPSSSAASAAMDAALSDESLGSSLMHSAFLLLAKKLNDGSIGVHTPPSVLHQFAAEYLGSSFQPNFEGNLFQNLQSHPLIQKMKNEKRQAMALAGKSASVDGSPVVTPQHPTRLSNINEIPTLVLPAQFTGGRTSLIGGSQSARTSSDLRKPQSAPNPTSTDSSTHPSPHPIHGQFQPLRHPHAPPAHLSFHTLRYTLHQSFGTRHNKEVEQAALKKRQEVRAQTARNDPLSPNASTSIPSLASPSSPSNAQPPSSARSSSSPHRRRGRSRQARKEREAEQRAATAAATAAHHTAATSLNPDREYSRAVASSKYRREHNNSPTSHWMRLQELVSQRTQQARALNNMAYFNPEGNVFQQGGMLNLEPPANKDSSNSNVPGQTNHEGGTSRTAHLNLTATSTRISPRKLRNIHEGQILRQVANTSWGSFLDETKENEKEEKDSAHHHKKNTANSDSSQGNITKRAELTLARCYADFDLAKKDLKERLYESLALMDTERSDLLLRKYKQFHPQFTNAENDILSMRLDPERKRFQVVSERLHNLEMLLELIEFINQQNGGNNGEPGSGMTGYTNGAALPTFEEIYFVEVLATLVDSCLPMRAGEGENRLGDFIKKQDYSEEKEVELGRYDPNSGIHPSLYALHAGQHPPGASTTNHSTNPSRHGSTMLPPTTHSIANSVVPSRRGTTFVQATNTSGPSGANSTLPGSSLSVPSLHHALPLSYHNTHLPTITPIPAQTPPPSFLLLLLCLSPSIFKYKEVREALDKWARLCGLSEETADAALRMVGVDPRLATYSGRGAIKAPVNTTLGGGAGENSTGLGGSGSIMSPAQMLLLSEGALGGLLDSSTKNALLKSGVVVPPAPVSRPLSSVILAPVALGEWESLKRGERVKQSARDLARRVKAVRDLTTSSNASTRNQLGLGSPRQAKFNLNQFYQNSMMPLPPMNMVPTSLAHSGPVHSSGHPPSHHPTKQLPILAEEAGSTGEAGNSHDRPIPKKHATGSSKQLSLQEREERTMLRATNQL